MQTRPTPSAAALALLALVVLAAAGCVGTTDEPTGTARPTARAVPASPSTSPTPSPSVAAPSASATPSTPSTPSTASTASDPAAEADGCPPPHDERAALPAPTAEVLSTSNERFTRSPAGRPIDVGITLVEGDAAAERITATVRRHVEDLIAEWDGIVGPPGQDDADHPEPELQLQVSAVRLGTQLVSLELDGFQYLGGASGNAIADAWTFATATGTQLGLDDVGLDGDCLDELGELAADALQDQGVGMFEEAEADLRAGAVALHRWSVTDQHLRLHFPTYEVAPGAAGAPVAEIPLAKLREATGTPLGARG